MGVTFNSWMDNGTAVVHAKHVWLSGGDTEDTNAPIVSTALEEQLWEPLLMERRKIMYWGQKIM